MGKTRLKSLWIRLLIAVVVSVLAAWATDRAMTSYAEGPGFHRWLEQKASHGLHLTVTMGDVARVGLTGFQTDHANGVEGLRSIQSINARGITGSVDLSGLLVGVWDVQGEVQQAEIRLQRVNAVPTPPASSAGPVTPLPAVPLNAVSPSPEIPQATTQNGMVAAPVGQTNSAMPTEPPPVPATVPTAGPIAIPVAPVATATPAPAETDDRPWYLWLLPKRVRLKHVLIDDGTAVMTVLGQDGGFYHSKIVLTPNGRDYEYDGTGGEFRMPLMPKMNVTHVHLLATKAVLTIYELLIAEEGEHPERTIHMEGSVGLSAQDKSIHMKVDWHQLDVSQWLPAGLPINMTGLASGNFQGDAADFGLERAVGAGHVSLDNSVISGVKHFSDFTDWTGSPPRDVLQLKQASSNVTINSGTITLNNLVVECDGVFRVEGTLSVTALDHQLSGVLQFGMADAYSKWLGGSRKEVFADQRSGYYFTDVHVSGTLESPKEDLSKRVIHVVESNPFLALKLLINKVTK